MRTAILLGAGASYDAGLPLTNMLARELVSKMNDDGGSRGAAIVNFVYGAMVSHVTQAGGNPFTAVNVETMISAIRLLAQRATHEAAPFVQAWSPAVGTLDSSGSVNGSSLANELLSGVSETFRLDGHGSGDKLLKAVREVVQAETGSGGDGSSYAALELKLRELLVELLGKPLPPESVQYLTPIVDLAGEQAGGVDIVTLNYDLTIETAAAIRSVPVNRGIEKWRPGKKLQFPARSGTINLLKPHGSVDWVIDTLLVERGMAQTYARVRSGRASTGGPAVVIGDREKLETEGPTLALMRAFEDVLRRSGRLVIVGYSGGDSHVNSTIKDWVNSDRTRTITVLDPSWPRECRYWRREDTDFRQELNRYLGKPGDSLDRRRMVVIRKGAREGLAEAMIARPESDPLHWFSAEAVVTAYSVEIVVTNHGRDLGTTSFYPRDLRTGGSSWPNSIQVDHPNAIESDHVVSLVSIPLMRSGESVRVTLEFGSDTAAHEWFLKMTGEREIDEISQDFRATPPDSSRESPGTA